jgi:hypothetical protein
MRLAPLICALMARRCQDPLIFLFCDAVGARSHILKLLPVQHAYIAARRLDGVGASRMWISKAPDC